MTAPTAGGDNLILIGPMGAGKSSVARELARMTKRRLVDTDRLVVQSAGKPISEIFADEGEARFRELEANALESLTQSRRLIIATGGGIVERSENREAMRALGCVIWLIASDDMLFSRVSRTSHRPLLQTDDPRGKLEDLLARRRPLYEACAHCGMDTTELTLPQAAERALALARDFFQSRVP